MCIRDWHYVNLSPGLSFDSVKHFLETATQDNIYNKINLLVAELYNKNLSLEQKQFNLKFLIHLIGDLHQPLHVGRLEDRGGNSVKVKWFGASSNLHRVWDEGLIEFQQLSYTEYARAINFSSKEQRENLNTKTLAAWVFASYQVASGIYADITEPDQKLNYAYNYKYLAVINNQLLEGGIHLANLLNEIFG
ncbi:MAG TPA: S1/P1 Nuclease [Chitinophagaceae bacterium]|nr:S1/P1 Nuclease [Chitinophagaceae bacterium]